MFISSTFKDMQADRDELVKFVFPRLRDLCEARGVAWSEVDLRWGITDEEKAEGQVLPCCLEEIRNCRPYFIGLLGERYGWTPEEIPSSVIQREPWLGEITGKSVTELEILHGVLRNPDMAQHAFFYLRDPAYIEGLPEDERPTCREEPTAEDIQRYGAVEADRRARERRRKLDQLKETIRASGFPCRLNYANPKALGEAILQDFTGVVNLLFPAEDVPDELTREIERHERFAAQRTAGHLDRAMYTAQLDDWVSSGANPMVLVGESGSGKSTLLAAWALSHRRQHRDDLVIMHFMGASPASSSWMSMVRRIARQIARWTGQKIALPAEATGLQEVLAMQLQAAAAHGRVVVVLDGLDRLEDRDGAPDLVWLPRDLPPNIRLVASALPGRSLEESRRRNWDRLVVEPFSVEEQRQLAETFLGSYGKRLPGDQVETILTHPRSSNPLFLATLLDELRLWGEHETITRRIAHYLAAVTVDDLFEKVLERCESDYQSARPGVVRDILSLLWSAHHGLTEAEILELAGADGQPLPSAFWSPLYLAIRSHLSNRDGILAPGHDYFRKAIHDRYLPMEEERRRLHLRLADYFAVRSATTRTVAELPWQLARAGAWERLRATLCQPDLFMAMDLYDLVVYWRLLKGSPGAGESYQDMLHRLQESSPASELLLEAMERVARFHVLNNGMSEAEQILEGLLALTEGRLGPTHPSTAGVLNDLATVLCSQGRENEAEPLYVRALAIQKETLGPESTQVATTLNNLGLLRHTLGKYEEAEEAFQRSLDIYEKPSRLDTRTVAGIVSNLAALRISQADAQFLISLQPASAEWYDSAEKLCRLSLEWRQELLGREHPETAESLMGLAEVLIHRACLDESGELLNRAEAIWCRLLPPNHLTLGTLCFLRGEQATARDESEEALVYFEKAWEIFHLHLPERHQRRKMCRFKLSLTRRRLRELQSNPGTWLIQAILSGLERCGIPILPKEARGVHPAKLLKFIEDMPEHSRKEQKKLVGKLLVVLLAAMVPILAGYVVLFWGWWWLLRSFLGIHSLARAGISFLVAMQVSAGLFGWIAYRRLKAKALARYPILDIERGSEDLPAGHAAERGGAGPGFILRSGLGAFGARMSAQGVSGAKTVLLVGCLAILMLTATCVAGFFLWKLLLAKIFNSHSLGVVVFSYFGLLILATVISGWRNRRRSRSRRRTTEES